MGCSRLRLLGGVELKTSAGLVVPIPRKKAQALLAYLACHPGQAQARDKLATLFWPEMVDQQARANLRKALFVLRSHLSAVEPGLRIEDEAVALDVTALDVDVLAFQRLARRADPESLQQAAELYQGNLLEGLNVTEAPFEEWLREERERLREVALETLARLLGHQAKADDASAAIATALRLLSLDPLQEAVHRALMRIYARQGRRDAALRQYQSCVDTIRRELNVEPETETRDLYGEILRGRATPFETAGHASTSGRRPLPPLSDEPPMIGREPELTRLVIALDEALAARGQLISVVGEAGIGKSRLVGQLGVEAAKRGARVFVGHAYPTEQALAYGVWVDALRTSGALGRADVLTSVAAPWRAELARLFPELAEGDDPRAAAPRDPVRLFEAVAHLLERLASAQPLVLLLEDLHWADEMSIRLTSVLSRRVAAWRVLIVVTARDEDVAEAPVLRDLLRRPGIATLPLAPLSQAETTTLLESLSPQGRSDNPSLRWAERIWTASGGNPFVIVELVKSLEQQTGPMATPDALSLPQGVRELVGTRLDRVSDRGRALAALACVIGRNFEFELLQRASGLGEGEAAAGVEELVRRRVLRAIGEQLAFVHDRVREVVYAELLPFRRKLLHRQVAETVESLHATDLAPHVAVLGQHYREGEVWDKAFDYLRQAGSHAYQHAAYRASAAYYTQALSVFDQIPRDKRRSEDAIDVRLEFRLPLLYVPGSERITTLLTEAAQMAEAAGDDPRLARVLAFEAQHHWASAEYSRASELIEQSVALWRSRGLVPPPEATRYRGYVLVQTGDYRSALATLDEAERQDRRFEGGFTGDPILREAFIIVHKVAALVELGRFDDGLVLAGHALRRAEEVNHDIGLALAGYVRGRVALGRGDVETAIPLLERSVTFCVERPYRTAFPVAAGWLGAVYLSVGRTDDALRILHEAVRAALPTHTFCSIILAEAYLDADRAGEAGRLAQRTLATARRIGERGTEAWGLRLLGTIASRAEPQDRAGAARYYGEALGLAAELGMRPLVAHCHLGLGTLHRSTDRRDLAHHHLTTAAKMFAEMNMASWRDKTEAALRGCAK